MMAFFRPVVLARELTKLHEDIFRGTLADAVARYSGGDGDADSGGGSGAAANSGGVVKDPRGEFTVILGPRAATSDEEGGAEGAARAMAALEARWVTMFRREIRAHWARGGIVVYGGTAVGLDRRVLGREGREGPREHADWVVLESYGKLVHVFRLRGLVSPHLVTW